MINVTRVSGEMSIRIEATTEAHDRSAQIVEELTHYKSECDKTALSFLRNEVAKYKFLAYGMLFAVVLMLIAFVGRYDRMH